MRKEIDDRDDHVEPTPAPVIWSVALGVGPLPFLGVYAVLFLIHGLFYPVQPPDITSTRGGEAVAGAIAAALFVLGAVFLLWFLNGRRRWPFVLGQLATLATALDFVLDSTTGPPAVPALLAVTSLTALVLAAHPASWRHVGVRGPRVPARRRRRRAEPAAAPARFGADEVDAAISDVRF